MYQENIFALLHNSYPPVCTYGIELIKQIYDQPKFKVESFLEWLDPLMMRNDCKGGIKSSLSILEKVVKSHPELNQSIASVVAAIYVIPDLALQEKATKFILKIASPKDTLLIEKLESFVTLMQGNVRILLSSFIDKNSLTANTEDIPEYEFHPKKELLLVETVEVPQNWNDIIFQFGKFLNSEDVLDSEILLNVYITQKELFPADYSVQLQPYVKQLQKYYSESVHRNFMKSFLIQKNSKYREQI